LQVRARAPPSPPRSGYACRTAPIDWARYGAHVTKPVTTVSSTETRNLVIRRCMRRIFPSPLAGEGGEWRAHASYEPGEGGVHLRYARPLTRSLRSRPLPAQRGEESKSMPLEKLHGAFVLLRGGAAACSVSPRAGRRGRSQARKDQACSPPRRRGGKNDAKKSRACAPIVSYVGLHVSVVFGTPAILRAVVSEIQKRTAKLLRRDARAGLRASSECPLFLAAFLTRVHYPNLSLIC
jgi:hypothetical protein